MRFDLIITREQGKVIPCWRHAFPVRLRGARVCVESTYQRAFARYMLTARVISAEGARALPAPLWDVRLIDLTDDRLTLAGFERIEEEIDTPRDYAQSWVLLPSSQ